MPLLLGQQHHSAYSLATSHKTCLSLKCCVPRHKQSRTILKMRADSSVKLSALTTNSVAPTAPTPAPKSGTPIPSLLAAGVGFVGLAAIVYKKFAARPGSLHGLEDRGYLSADRDRRDVFMKDVMRNVNTVPMPELSDDLISAARARRQKERANHKLSLEEIELPENHPWAVRSQANQEDEEVVRARLRVQRRGGAFSSQQPAADDASSAPRRVRMPAPPARNQRPS